MADELTIKVSAKLSEDSVSTIQSQLDNIGKNKKEGIKLQLDKTINTQINALKKNLEQISKKIYPIKFQIDQTSIGNIQNLTDSLNKAIANVQNTISRQTPSYNGGMLNSGGYTGVAKIIQKGKIDEINGFEPTSEIEKRNLALGETLTIFRELKKAQDEEIGQLEEVGRQYETNYEEQAKAAAKAAKEEQKEVVKGQELAYKSQQKWENQLKKIRDRRIKEDDKAQEKVNNYLAQQDNAYKNLESSAFAQKGSFDKDSPYGQTALEALQKYRDEIDKLQSDSSLYGKGSRKEIEDRRQEAQRVIKEQKALYDADNKLEEDQQKKIEKKRKEYDKIAEQSRKAEEKAEKEARDYERKEQEKAEKERARALAQQQKEEAAYQKQRERDASMYAGMFDTLDKTKAKAIGDIAGREIDLDKLESKAFSGTNALTGDYETAAKQKIEALRNELTALKKEAEKTGQAISSETAQSLDKKFSNLKNEIDQLQKLEYPSDKLAAKNVDALKSEYSNKINEFRNSLNDAGKGTSEFATKLDELESKLASVGKVDGTGTPWAEWKNEFEQLQGQFKEFESSAVGMGQKLSQSIESAQITQINELSNKLGSLDESRSGAGVANLIEHLNQLKQSYSEIQSQLQSEDLDKGQYDQLVSKLKELDTQFKQIVNASKIFNDGVGNEQALSNYQLDVENLTSRFERLKQKYDEFVAANPSKASPELANSIGQFADRLKEVDPTNIKEVSKEFRNLNTAVNNAVNPVQSLGQLLQNNLGGLGQYLARFVSATYLIGKTVSVFRKMNDEVKALDTSLMELQKVTTLSGDSLTQFTDKAYNLGKEVGRTGKDVIDAVTTFSRAGYDLNESTQLAQSALTMTNVGVDIPNTEAAASDMISILRAYDKQANESMQVIDELYNVANKEPLDFGNITDMLVTAGGTLAQTNTSLEESMGLLTGAFATMRDTSVANG